LKLAVIHQYFGGSQPPEVMRMREMSDAKLSKISRRENQILEKWLNASVEIVEKL
jgi:hypothetical protein